MSDPLKQAWNDVGAKLSEENIPPIPHRGDLSGADIEGMIGRAWRGTLLAGEEDDLFVDRCQLLGSRMVTGSPRVEEALIDRIRDDADVRPETGHLLWVDVDADDLRAARRRRRPGRSCRSWR